MAMSIDQKNLLLVYARRAWRKEMMIGAALTTRTVVVKYIMFLLSSCLTAAGSGRLWMNIFFFRCYMENRFEWTSL